MSNHQPRSGAPRAERLRTRRAVVVVLALLGSVTATLPSPASAAVTLPGLRISASAVVAGKPVTASIDAGVRAAGTTLVLERRYPDTWRTADPTATAAGDRLRFTVPTSQYGAFTFRVAARRGGALVATSAWKRLRVRPPYTPVGDASQRTFQRDRTRHRIIRWDPCRPVRWVFNPANRPDGGLAQVKEGVRRIEAATGLDFRYVGETKLNPNPYGTGLKSAEVVIGWRTPAGYPPFRGTAAVGHGGSSYYADHREPDGTWVNRAALGGVVLNAAMDARLADGYGSGLTWGEVVIHELGHVVGLDHTPARQQIMHRQMSDRNADWGAGDLAGLERLGDTRGCLRAVTARAVPPRLQRHAAP